MIAERRLREYFVFCLQIKSIHCMSVEVFADSLATRKHVFLAGLANVQMQGRGTTFPAQSTSDIDDGLKCL